MVWGWGCIVSLSVVVVLVAVTRWVFWTEDLSIVVVGVCCGMLVSFVLVLRFSIAVATSPRRVVAFFLLPDGWDLW